MASRTREINLIMPALRLLKECQDPNQGLSTFDLRRQLRMSIEPTAADLEPLKNRADDRLSQVLRNLISHRTLERKGLATYYRDPITNEGFYRLTKKGAETLSRQR